MPIWLRRYTNSTIREFYEKEKEEYDKAAGKSKTITNNSPIARPPIPSNNPTYSTKALKNKGLNYLYTWQMTDNQKS